MGQTDEIAKTLKKDELYDLDTASSYAEACWMDEENNKIVASSANEINAQIEGAKDFTFSNTSGQQVMLLPDQIVVISGDNMIILDNAKGIIINSTNSINIKAANDLVIDGKELKMIGSIKMKASVTSQSVEMVEGKLNVRATKVEMDI